MQSNFYLNKNLSMEFDGQVILGRKDSGDYSASFVYALINKDKDEIEEDAIIGDIKFNGTKVQKLDITYNI